MTGGSNLVQLSEKMDAAMGLLEALELAVTSPAITLAQRNPLSVLAAEVRERFEVVADALGQMATTDRLPESP